MVRLGRLPVRLCSALLITGYRGGDGPATPEPDDSVASVAVWGQGDAGQLGIDLFGVTRAEPVRVVES